MTILRFEIDSDKDVDSIAGSIALFASAVFNERFPGEDGLVQWHEAMTTVVETIHEHVRLAGLEPGM